MTEAIALLIAALGFSTWFTLALGLVIVKCKGETRAQWHADAAIYSFLVFACAALTVLHINNG